VPQHKAVNKANQKAPKGVPDKGSHLISGDFALLYPGENQVVNSSLG